MAEFNSYGPTEAQYLQFTNQTVDNSTEFIRQRARAQETINQVCAHWERFHFSREITLTAINTGTLVVTSSSLTSDKSGYYNKLELVAVEGSGRTEGFVAYIDDYDGSNLEATLVVTTGAITDIDTSTTFTLRQRDSFPRVQDVDVRGTPKVPEFVVAAISYTLEYWLQTDDECGFNSVKLGGFQSEIFRERLGNWEVQYQTKRDDTLRLIGTKTLELLEKHGAIKYWGSF